ncbi:MAG: LysM peptidoglycan-binding domain-containing protein [Anaerolineae bacterium]|nr:LysM peptidoglycan-binding domain-containing protein [Anaerolineae bacterium]
MFVSSKVLLMKHSHRFLVTLMLLVLFTVAALPASAAPLAQSETVYSVKAGDTLTQIALRYGVSQQALMDANGIVNPSLIVVGQRLVIPGDAVTPVAEEAPPSEPAEPTIHVVSPGETLSGIAAQYGVSAGALAYANNIDNPSMIRSGQRLTIPESTATAPASQADTSAVAPATVQANTEYVVGSGDTLADIAQQYDTTVAAIAAANGITNPSQIFQGQRLIIPAVSAPTTRPAPQGNLSVTVSINQQRCKVYQGEEVLYNWPCSTGRAGSGTKTGTFYVQSKIREAWGSRWGFYMPYWLGIYWAGGSENGIHGLPYAPGGYPIWANSVGTPVTFGCVLLGANESATLWDMAYIGMPVTISY